MFRFEKSDFSVGAGKNRIVLAHQRKNFLLVVNFFLFFDLVADGLERVVV